MLLLMIYFIFSAPGHGHFHPGVAGVEVETGVAEEAGVVVKDMAGEELVLLAEEVIGLLRLIFYFHPVSWSYYFCPICNFYSPFGTPKEARKTSQSVTALWELCYCKGR